MNITTVLTYSLGPSLYRFCCSNAEFVKQELQVWATDCNERLKSSLGQLGKEYCIQGVEDWANPLKLIILLFLT